jgi:amino acid adenylation domain-containing protein
MLVHQFLENAAARFPDKTALICDHQRLTYGQLNAVADQLAAAFIEMGIKRQDRIIIFLENSVESVVSLYAVLKAGAVFVMLHPGMKTCKLNFIIKDSGARAVITHSVKSSIVLAALSDATDLEYIIWCGKSPAIENSQAESKTSCSWDSIVSARTTLNALLAKRTIDLDIATIIYTSGSSGEPKGVVSAHYNVVAAATSITNYLKNQQDDIILCSLPLSFDYGLYQAFMTPLFGGTLVLEKSFVFPLKIIERLVQEKVTGFPIVPTMAAILSQMEILSEYDFSSLRYITNTAAALHVSSIRKLRSQFPNVAIYSMYGLTECKRALYLPPEDLDIRPSSVGIAIPNSEVFVVDKYGNEVDSGETGELVVRGLNVMQGYWNRPEETAKTFRPGRYRGDALLYTGDLFKKDNEGYLYFIGRKDEMIKTKGERVSPKEIENALCSMPGVAEAAVLGVPDNILGQAIKAHIVSEKDISLTSDEIMKYCSKSLEPFMVPKYVDFRQFLPKISTGKIDKKVLSESAKGGWDTDKRNDLEQGES